MKPMLCGSATPMEAREIVKDEQWTIEFKYDGVRAYIENGKLFDRRGQEITKKFPEFEGLSLIKGLWDGEIIAQTGEFNDVSGRMHLKDPFQIKLLAKKTPARLVLFDAPNVLGGLEDRRAILKEMSLPDWALCGDTYSGSEFESLWGDVLDKQLEGLVLKRLGSPYEHGKRSPHWLKVKSFVETVARFTKFEEHPRGITIETDDGRRVVVNGAQAAVVKQHFNTQTYVDCEIQYLPQKDSEAWRFPSFRGIKCTN